MFEPEVSYFTIPRLKWYKREIGDGNDWSVVALLLYIKSEWKEPIFDSDVGNADVKLSTFTGALTFPHFQQTDEGWYQCQMARKKGTLLELHLFGSYFDPFNLT